MSDPSEVEIFDLNYKQPDWTVVETDRDDEPLTWRDRWYWFNVNVLWWFKPRVAMRRGRKVWSRWFPSKRLCLRDWCFRRARPDWHACQLHYEQWQATRDKASP